MVYLQESRPESCSSPSNAWTHQSHWADFSFKVEALPKGKSLPLICRHNRKFSWCKLSSVFSWQKMAVVCCCCVSRRRQTDRDVMLVCMMCLYQSSVLADGLLNPSDTMCVCVCMCAWKRNTNASWSYSLRQLNDWPLWLQPSSVFYPLSVISNTNSIFHLKIIWNISFQSQKLKILKAGCLFWDADVKGMARPKLKIGQYLFTFMSFQITRFLLWANRGERLGNIKVILLIQNEKIKAKRS